MQIAENAHAAVRWFSALALSLALTLAGTLAVTPASAQDQPAAAATAKPKAVTKPKAKAKAKKRSKAKKKVKSRNKAKARTKAAAKPAAKTEPAPSEAAKAAEPDQPGIVTAAKLPGAIRTLHICAAEGDKVEFSREAYAAKVVFFVSCPPTRGKLTPIVVYVASDATAGDAKRVTFELLAADGTSATHDTIPSAVPARAAFTKPGEDQANMHTKDDEVWLVGAWRPDDDPRRCAVSANWRVQGEKAELWLWEEASECAVNAVPKYLSKVDKKPPPLVGR